LLFRYLVGFDSFESVENGDSALPVFEFEIAFFKALGLRHETGARYLQIGILKADAKTPTGRRLFRMDSLSIERAMNAINAYRARRKMTIK
jgi:hypothetical protein